MSSRSVQTVFLLSYSTLFFLLFYLLPNRNYILVSLCTYVPVSLLILGYYNRPDFFSASRWLSVNSKRIELNEWVRYKLYSLIVS